MRTDGGQDGGGDDGVQGRAGVLPSTELLNRWNLLYSVDTGNKCMHIIHLVLPDDWHHFTYMHAKKTQMHVSERFACLCDLELTRLKCDLEILDGTPKVLTGLKS